MSNVILEPRLVGDIEGVFYIPSYQRGYRWGELQVKQLLDDIKESKGENYCLQPVVVKHLENGEYELIDGQQRMTTLYLILAFMKQHLPSINIKFSINYQTRLESASFIENINIATEEQSLKNIDFFHIFNAYKTISEWFKSQSDIPIAVIDIYRHLYQSVKVIWYEASSEEDSTSLFTRLNIGKIKLTNAELVRALFLSRDGEDINKEKQLEISISWDSIEKELRDEELWYFLTNKASSKYSTRIELIFDMMAARKDDERDEYFTFLYFVQKIKQSEPAKVWFQIQSYYQYLKSWYEDRDIYHKIGYLISVGENITNIIKLSKDKKKSEFQSALDEHISRYIPESKTKILSLLYSNDSDKETIERVLLLFNVESVRIQESQRERYSFFAHKSKEWSLEHIHAQKAEGLNTNEARLMWLRLHQKSLKGLYAISQNEDIKVLIDKIDPYIKKTVEITGPIFENIFLKVLSHLSEDNEIHDISNLALLGFRDNAALNNSTFDVKRNKILEMDNAGEYIPLCTKRAFMKYYTKSQYHQLHFWGQSDRDAYIDAMLGGEDASQEGVITKYLR